MVEIQSKEVIDKISDELKVQPSLAIPRELAKDIQLVYNINPERRIVFKQTIATDATAAVIHGTHPTKRTFLTFAQISVSKDVVNDSTSSALSIFPIGRPQTNVFMLRYEPLTAGNAETNTNYTIPIELEKNTSVVINNGSGTASIDTVGIIGFFETDPQ